MDVYFDVSSVSLAFVVVDGASYLVVVFVDEEGLEAVVAMLGFFVGFWFDEDEANEERMEWSTRENGDVYEEEAGHEDLLAAREFVRAVRKIPGVDASYEPVDEWVHVTVYQR